MILTTMVKCSGVAGVNNIDGCPTPVGREGCVRPCEHKSCLPSVGTGDVKTHRCCCPPWRCHRGESTFPCSRHGLVDVFWRKPRFQVGSVRWRRPQHRHFVGSIVFGDMTWRFNVALLWCHWCRRPIVRGTMCAIADKSKMMPFLGLTKPHHLFVISFRNHGWMVRWWGESSWNRRSLKVPERCSLSVKTWLCCSV
jgi:hypothetical protein